MGTDQIINYVRHFIDTNQAGAIAAGVILLYLLVKKPKVLVILILLCAVGIGFMQIYGKLSKSGINDKDFSSLSELK
ncbi:MAG: hypothetical protein AB1499_03335 [Nitrospirota bacterium]